jgi:hypothetical protein
MPSTRPALAITTSLLPMMLLISMALPMFSGSNTVLPLCVE